MTKRFAKYIVAILVLSISFSCSVKFPRAISENALGPQTGKAIRTTYLGLISVGDDTSIETAAKNGGIKYISSVDYQLTDILGIISTQTVIVTGSSEAPISASIEKETKSAPFEEKVAQKPAEKSIEKSIEKTVIETGQVLSETGRNVAEKVNKVENEVKTTIKEKPESRTTVTSTKRTTPEVKNAPKAEEPHNTVEEAPVVARNRTNTSRQERVEPKEVEIPEEVTPAARTVKGFSIKAKSMSELAAKIKSMSTEYMQYGDLNPIDIKLNVNTLTFSCNFTTKDTGFIKLGLYYGPKATGCESCENVLNNNTGSKVVNQGISNLFAYQLIAIYSK